MKSCIKRGNKLKNWEQKYREIAVIVEKELSCSAHDMDHVWRVYNLAHRLVGEKDRVDIDILLISALLHDIARVKEDSDSTGKINHAVLGAEMAEDILIGLGYPGEKIAKIKHCIISHRYRAEHEPQTIEAKLLFDADKLDVLGAVGVARSFMFAGKYSGKMYSDVPVDRYIRENLEGGKHNGKIKDISRHTPNLEFETKFVRISERLYTNAAKEIARERLEYMRGFFARLEKEISGMM
ncbi:MAG TPA: HD domain-containing protein [Chitinispirillaceae bacterium]|nr:HD domain-containing protein [Chitinispirillaceae bacterium]